MNITREELALTIDESEWSWLRAHMERGGLILVDKSLDLVDAAYNVSLDNIAVIEQRISAGTISKPTHKQIQEWDKDRTRKFSMLIVSPYVLIQERMPSSQRYVLK